VGCFLALNYLAAAGEFHWSGVGTLNGVALALSFFCIVLPVGRFAGVDALLVRRPNTRAVKAEFVDEPIAAPRAPPD